MLKPLITFTTDFGLSDHFAAVMKGVVLSLAPDARLVDITHDVTPFEVAEAAYTLAQSHRYFPEKTIHVVVVDPGVGTTRRPLLAEMAGQYFVAPDNGVLSMILSREKSKVRHITNAKYMLHPVSRTFHGRDVFAPVAAHLANGVPPSRFGKLIDDHLRLALDRPTRTGKRVWTGAVLKVDRFGNLITNLHVDDFPQIATRPFELNVGLEKIERLSLTFTECQPGVAFAIVGSSGYIEVAVNQGSAARTLGCAAGSPVELALY
jgi:S-adenosyl-L-methionine hydrolase (adenosine-forming)